MKINNKVKYLGLFLIFFLLMFFLSMIFGDINRFQLSTTEPLTWKESIAKVPMYAIISLLITAWIYYVQIQQSKKKKEHKP